MSRTIINTFTDSAGITADYVRMEDVVVGDQVISGWQPWAVVVAVEREEGTTRMRMRFEDERWEGGRPGHWLSPMDPVPVVPEDA